MIVITGASGQLGRLVINKLLESVSPTDLVAAVRSPEKVKDLAERGVEVRQADYNRPGTLDKAFAGADKLLLISSSEVGRRAPQHANVITAAKKANVGLIAYTSILHADSTPLSLGGEHRQTEAFLAESGLPYVLLRNGWYTENYMAGIPAALKTGVLLGSAGEGRISSAARADYAEAAAAVLLSENPTGMVYELAGDEAYTLSEFADIVSKQSGKSVRYQNMTESEYAGALKSAGLPADLAKMLADSDAGACKGGLFDDSKTLSHLIGRPTTRLSQMVRETVAP